MDVRGGEGRPRWGSGGRPRHKDRTRAATSAAILSAGLGFTGLKNMGRKHKELEQFLCPRGLKRTHTANGENSAQVAKKKTPKAECQYVLSSHPRSPSQALITKVRQISERTHQKLELIRSKDWGQWIISIFDWLYS